MASSERKRQLRSMGRNGAARAAKSRTYPLRKVLSHSAQREYKGVLIDAVTLECGHYLAPPEDLRGCRYPARMRCWQCAAGRPPEFGVDLEEGSDG